MEKLQQLIEGYGNYSCGEMIDYNNMLVIVIIIASLVSMYGFVVASNHFKEILTGIITSLFAFFILCITVVLPIYLYTEYKMSMDSFKEIINVARDENITAEELLITEKLIAYGDYNCRHKIDIENYVYTNNEGYWTYVE